MPNAALPDLEPPLRGCDFNLFGVTLFAARRHPVYFLSAARRHPVDEIAEHVTSLGRGPSFDVVGLATSGTVLGIPAGVDNPTSWGSSSEPFFRFVIVITVGIVLGIAAAVYFQIKTSNARDDIGQRKTTAATHGKVTPGYKPQVAVHAQMSALGCAAAIWGGLDHLNRAS